jgi:Na+-transporting NADH:ubiquinone oxidoreductase subunit NqrC
MTHKLGIVEQILLVALCIALACSIIICFQVYILKDKHYTRMFSTWQMPMIFAILADLYFIR